MEKLHDGVPDRSTTPPRAADELPTAEVVQRRIRDGELSTEARTKLQRDAVVEAMRSAWRAYEQSAWGFDELKPIKKKGHSWIWCYYMLCYATSRGTVSR